MKNFKTLLQNACEDYSASLDHAPTIEDVKDVCETHIADVVWDALHRAKHTREFNSVPQTRAKDLIKRLAHSLIGKSVTECQGTLTHLFACANNYGFKFEYGTQSGIHNRFEPTIDPEQVVTGYTLHLK